MARNICAEEGAAQSRIRVSQRIAHGALEPASRRGAEVPIKAVLRGLEDES